MTDLTPDFGTGLSLGSALYQRPEHEGQETQQERKVLVVDDDALFREALGVNLKAEGYDVRSFSSGGEALEYLATHPNNDPILLDWRMPELDGLEILRRLRNKGQENPVIFLTMLNDEIYEEAALKWGAVDFIDKSRRFSIIAQRLSLAIRNARPQNQDQPGNPAVVREEQHNKGAEIYGVLQLYEDIHRAFWQGERLDLTMTEYSIVRLLARRAGEDVTYRDLYDLVHGKDFMAGYGNDGYKANVRSFIKRIRKKFRDIDEGFDAIENYPGFGYRWKKSAL